MGGPEDEPQPNPRRLSTPVLAGVLGVAVLGTIGLAKYAVDVLLVCGALLAGGLLLHFVGSWLAESDLLSPSWFTAFVLFAAITAWTLLVPDEGLAGLGRYIPKRVVKLIEWSESKGWAHRLFIRSRGAPPSADPAAGSMPVAVAPPSEPIDTPRTTGTSGSGITLTGSASSVREGHLVVLTARLADRPATGAAGTVTFYDGLRPLGAARLVSEGNVRVARLTVALSAGTHRLTASTGGGPTGWQSQALFVTVSP